MFVVAVVVVVMVRVLWDGEVWLCGSEVLFDGIETVGRVGLAGELEGVTWFGDRD